MLESVFIFMSAIAFLLFIFGIEKDSIIYSFMSLMLWIVVMASSLYIEVPTVTDAYVEYGGDVTICSGGCSLWDARIVSRAVGLEAHEWFYNDVIEHNGNTSCWIW